MKTPLFSIFAIGLLLVVNVSAQSDSGLGTDTSKTDDEKNKTDDARKPAKVGFWEVTLSGGNYIVAVDKITSVSRQKYLLDGALVVDEVTVDTVGQALARFYYIVPVGADSGSSTAAAVVDRSKAVLNLAGQRTGVELDTMVVKKYPETTHARTIEYRIKSEAELKSLFESARNAWQNGTGSKYTEITKPGQSSGSGTGTQSGTGTGTTK